MARTALTALQSSIVAALQADPWFAGIPIIADMGAQADYERFEKALAEEGITVVVHTVKGCSRVASARGVALVRAMFDLEVVENPDRNPESANKDLLTTASNALRIVTSFDSGPGESQPEPESNLMDLAVNDTGLRAFILPFSKIVQLS
jgi:hypothetical protein